MGTASAFEKEKLICAMLYTSNETAQKAEAMLEKAFGTIEDVSAPYCFSDISPYYDAEMNGKVFRKIYSFTECKDPALLADIKVATNEMELLLSDSGNRRINLDPGFISCGRLTLATTKNAGHRIPLCKGIYVELTLFYARGAWHPFPWTYQDFRLPAVQEFLLHARHHYMQQRKSL